jgi:hypothetical protein
MIPPDEPDPADWIAKRRIAGYDHFRRVIEAFSFVVGISQVTEFARLRKAPKALSPLCVMTPGC